MTPQALATTEISACVGEIFREALHTEVPSPEADMFESAVLDSLGFIILVSELERRLEVEIPLEGIDIESFRTVERIVCFVQGLNGAVSAPAGSVPERRPE